jgi:hypothetical protein
LYLALGFLQREKVSEIVVVLPDRAAKNRVAQSKIKKAPREQGFLHKT